MNLHINVTEGQCVSGFKYEVKMSEASDGVRSP